MKSATLFNKGAHSFRSTHSTWLHTNILILVNYIRKSKQKEKILKYLYFSVILRCLSDVYGIPESNLGKSAACHFRPPRRWERVINEPMCSAVPPNSGSILRPDNDASSYTEAGEKNLIESSISVIIQYKIKRISIIGY